MPQFRAYQSRVSTSARIGAVAGDFGFAKASSDVGRVLGGIGQDILQRQAEAKFAGDKANYDQSVILQQQELQGAINEYRQKGWDDNRIREEIVQPKLQEFEDNIAQRGYARLGLDNAKNQWTVDRAKFEAGYENQVMQRELENTLEDNKVGYAMAMDNGDAEMAQTHLDVIKSIAGNDAVNDARFGYNYGRFQTDLESMRFDFLNGNYKDSEQYISALKDKQQDIADSEMSSGQKYQLEQTILSRMIDAGKAERKEVADGFRAFQSAIKSGDLGGEELESIERQIGFENTDMLMKANLEALKKEAPSSASVRAGLDIIGSYTRADGQYEKIDDALKAASKIKSGKVKDRVMWQLMEMYQEREQNNIEETTPLSTYRTDYLEQIGRMVVAGEKDLGWYDKKMKEFDEWKSANPKAEQEDYYKWRYEQLEADVMEFVQGISAPQTRGAGTGRALEDVASIWNEVPD
jgi:Ca2+-binding EF-hand superfamily protein